VRDIKGPEMGDAWERGEGKCVEGFVGAA